MVIKRTKYYPISIKNNLLYGRWINIKDRCVNPKCNKYEYYGGRGITVCKEWEDDFLSFYFWAIGNGWDKDLTIDRIDNDGPYSPKNCRFVERRINNRNTRLISRDNTSGYRGVSWHKNSKQWRASMTIDGKVKHLGYFKSPVQAALRYDVEAYLENVGRTTNFIG